MRKGIIEILVKEGAASIREPISVAD